MFLAQDHAYLRICAAERNKHTFRLSLGLSQLGVSRGMTQGLCAPATTPPFRPGSRRVRWRGDEKRAGSRVHCAGRRAPWRRGHPRRLDSTRLDSVVVCSAPHRSWPREEDGRPFVTLCSPFERTRLLRSSFALRDSRAIIRERYIRESDSFAFQFDPTRIDRAVKYTLRIHEGGNEGGRRWRL